MNRLLPLLLLAAAPALAEDLPPGLASARLLPGWTTPEGTRIAALDLVLEPGWKTYWRQPGDTGLPPQFDWAAAGNLGAARFHWPAPEAIASDDGVTLGYHDRLLLPFELTPADPSQPIELAATIDFGLCERVCVPARVTLSAPAAGQAPDPEIEAALARVPRAVADQPECRVTEIGDGMQVSVSLPAGEPVDLAALELADAPGVWVSTAAIADGRATADFVGPSGQPFPIDPADVVVTLLSGAGATESRGCRPAG